ncbi:MAG: sulfatase-like hydrolase/transferase [Planctomycetota bacterium]|jgi:arylsulfatase A-like enzyme
MKNRFLAALASLLLLPLGHAADRPNVMVFLVDDMGVMDTSVPFLTGADGQPKRYPLNDWYRTPGMERLAARGVRFNQFYAMSVCSPTRISVLTGQNAARHRTTNWINPQTDNAGPQGAPDWNWKGLARGDVTLPGILRGAGYRTIHVGKGHFGPQEHEGEDPANLGFDVNVAGHSWGAPGSYYGAKNFGWGTNRERAAVPGLEKYHGRDIFLSEVLTIEAKKHITETVRNNQPFFLYFAHYAVHAPFESDPRFAAHYADSDKPKNAQAFATLIEGMDKSLGDMLDHFEALGVAEDTLVIFVGDNGSDAPLGHQHAVACAAPLRGKKGAHYEGGMRVPFIASWVKRNKSNTHQKKLAIPAGAIQPQVASVNDIFPTLLSFLNVDTPPGHAVDGADLATLLTGKSDTNRPEQFLMHYPHGRHRSSYWTSWRDGDWKAIYHYFPDEQSEGARYQLFNLAADPFEQTNLATSRPDALRRVMRGLIGQLKAHGAVYPIDENGKPMAPVMP